MGIFSKDKTKTTAQRYDALIEKAKSLSTDEFVKVLTILKSQPDSSAIKPEDLCVDILEMIVSNRAYSPSKYYQLFNQAEKLYEAIFFYDEETPNFDKLRLVFLEMYREKNIVDSRLFDLKLFNSFENKEKYLILGQALLSNPNPSNVFALLKDYGIKIREYMLDDDMFLSNLVKVATKLSNMTPENMSYAVEEEIENVKRQNGIYNVDPSKIAKVEQNIKEASQIINNGVDVLKQVDIKSDEIAKLAEDRGNS